jgi:hypothetical protein
VLLCVLRMRALCVCCVCVMCTAHMHFVCELNYQCIYVYIHVCVHIFICAYQSDSVIDSLLQTMLPLGTDSSWSTVKVCMKVITIVTTNDGLLCCVYRCAGLQKRASLLGIHGSV